MPELFLDCDGVPNGTLCVYLRSTTSDPAGILFGDGITCLAGPLIRFGAQLSVDHLASATTATIAPGNTRYYACQYRNPAPGFCPPAVFNISNGFVIHW